MPLILSGDGIRSARILPDCGLHVSHMDGFPSVMEYLRIPIKDEWDLDGISRLAWETPQATQVDKCNLTKTKPVITLSGGYMFNSVDSERFDKTQTETTLDQCLSKTTDFGRFHY